LCIHGHFYQPARGNPITGEIGVEHDAAPYRNWNERVTAESYRPNALVGNFERMSFDVGEALMGWLEDYDAETYQRIIQSNRTHVEQHGIGNALARPYFHVILPLSRMRDKRTNLHWGRETFKHRFGFEPMGLWLPEMAFDMETLQAVRAAGFTYTILSQKQVVNSPEGGPYWVDLENGEQLAVFIRNDTLSDDLSFNIGNIGGAGHWARSVLGARTSRADKLTLIAVGGETFGHHHLGEEQFLKWLLQNEASAVGYKVITLNELLREKPPQETVTLKMFSSWSCPHGVARWVTGCPCTEGDSTWKGALRRALDNTSADLAELYQDAVRPFGLNPWVLRDSYIHVILGDQLPAAYLAEKLGTLTSEQEQRIHGLLEAQKYLLRAYNSFTFFYEDLDRPEPHYAIANAAYAIQLTRQATGADLGRRFRNELYIANSQRSHFNGAELYDRVMEEYFAPPPKVVVESGGNPGEPGAAGSGPAVGSTALEGPADAPPDHAQGAPHAAAEDSILSDNHGTNGNSSALSAPAEGHALYVPPNGSIEEPDTDGLTPGDAPDPTAG
jgi:alpha-amylase/alpha-mannosidase (GH57 family)